MKRASTLLATLFVLTLYGLLPARPAHAESPATIDDRPNVLWITSEDNGPQLGCYGDEYAETPNLDALASRSMMYLNCWSTAPVCAPARTCLISGMYPPSLGGEHMRSMTQLPARFKMYPQYLREAGYYCTNKSKEDYNLEKPGKVWDESSNKGHWRNREEGQPFFAVFNFTVSHESQIRRRPHTPVHDPAKARIPAYHPDTPESRRDWAQYYDKVTEMDSQAGNILKQLENDGLADDTIIFYYGDHGSGMPRSKRWPYNSGLHVPLIIHIPEKFKHLAPEDYRAGGKSERLVGFIDFPATLLSVCGIEPPEHFQGNAFLGEYATEPQEYQFGFRGRMDERYDMIRVARNQRYIYIRNYMPHKIYGQHIDYMFQTPTTQVWHDLYHAGKLTPPQTFFWERKPAEELYDLQQDPDEVNNLVDSAEHQEVLEELRTAQRKLAFDIRDVGFLPEAEIHTRPQGDQTPYDYGHSEDYDLYRILETAELAASLKDEHTESLIERLSHEDSAVRYWAAMGLLMRGKETVAQNAASLTNAMQDPSPSVRVVAAHALGLYSDESSLVEQALDVLVKHADIEENGVYIAMLAFNGIDEMDERALPRKADIEALPETSSKAPQRTRNYVVRLKEDTLRTIDE